MIKMPGRRTDCWALAILSKGKVSLDIKTDKDHKVTLLVHQIKPPPYLGGRVSFSTIRNAVPTVRDASCEFAKMARQGSCTLRHLRETKDWKAMRQKFCKLGGTRMGAAMESKIYQKRKIQTNLDQLLRMLMEKSTTKRVVVLLHMSKKGGRRNSLWVCNKEIYPSAMGIPACLCGQGELT